MRADETVGSSRFKYDSGGLRTDFNGDANRIDNAAPALIEKAYVILNQQTESFSKELGYGGIEGGKGSQALTPLTGKSASWWDWSDTASFEAAWQAASRANNGVPVTAGTRGDSPIGASGTGLVDAHEYTVVSTQDQMGERTITLRNPWGQGGSPPAGTTLSDGTPVWQRDMITISAADFMRYFHEVSALGDP